MADSTITLSLGDGPTYDTYASLFECLAGKAGWQQRHGAAVGWNITLNGTDVNVFDIDGDGVWCRPPIDDDWLTFGENQLILWDDVDSIVIL